jgi:hypothetical protein
VLIDPFQVPAVPMHQDGGIDGYKRESNVIFYSTDKDCLLGGSNRAQGSTGDPNICFARPQMAHKSWHICSPVKHIRTRGRCSCRKQDVTFGSEE